LVRAAGLVIVRQRSATAGGFFFLPLEDECGIFTRTARTRSSKSLNRNGVAIKARPGGHFALCLMISSLYPLARMTRS
jgi:hypothetical protein